MAIIRNKKVKKASTSFNTYGQNAGKAGIVYILCEMVNHHKMGKRKTDLYKIGESTRGGKVRAQQLSDDAKKEGSNVYYEFITEIATSDCYKTEQLVFKKLEEFREGNFWEDGGHEFFKFNNEEQVQHAIKVIRETCAEVDNPNEKIWVDESIGNLTNLEWLHLEENQLIKSPEPLYIIPESIGNPTKWNNPIKSPLPEPPPKIVPKPKIPEPEAQHPIKAIPEIRAEVNKSGVKYFFKTLFSVFNQTVESVEHLSTALNTVSKQVDEATKAYAEQVQKENKAALDLTDDTTTSKQYADLLKLVVDANINTTINGLDV